MSGSAKKADWKTKSMPKARRVVSVDINFSTEEYEELQKGIVPRRMENKWFIYFKNNNLYCHRSWTGFCIYIAKYREVNGEHFLYEIEVNNNRKQYTSQSDFHEVKNFLMLIEQVRNYDPDETLPSKKIIDNSLEIVEREFCNYYNKLPLELDILYNKLLDGHKLKLNSNCITKAIIQRLKNALSRSLRGF